MTASDLIAQLSDAGGTLRACAAHNLGVMGDAEAVPALIELLGSDRETDRRAVALALGHIGREDAAVALEGRWRTKTRWCRSSLRRRCGL